MVNLLTRICIVATCAMMVAAAPSEAPAAVDCSSFVYDLMDCMEYLVVGGSETTPDKSCCLGFKTLMEANEDCMCYALDTSASFGLHINITRAQALPAHCRVSSPPITTCHVSSTSPSGSPATSPIISAPVLPPAATPAHGGAPSSPPSAATPAHGGAPSSPPSAATPAHGGAPSSPPSAATPIRTPAASPVPTASPVSAPAGAPALGRAPMVAPTSMVYGLFAPPPENSGAWVISATFSSFLQFIIIFLV